MRRQLAVRGTDYGLVAGLVMVAGGLVVLAVAIGRGLGVGAAFESYLLGGSLFAGGWLALLGASVAVRWVWRRTRHAPERDVPALPAGIAVADRRAALLMLGRRQLPMLVLGVAAALASPRLAATLAGFSLLGLLLFPVWLDRRRRPQRYVVRGPGRWQVRWYVDERGD